MAAGKKIESVENKAPTTSKTWEFIKQNALAIIFGLVSIILAIALFRLSTKERVPILLLDNKIQIISKAQIFDAPIRIIKRDNNEEIRSDLIALRFYFWNAGNEPVKSENILQPIKIILADSTARLLDFKILKSSREVTATKLISSPLNADQSFYVDFNILEFNDGFTGQIIYEGSLNSKIKIEGTIEGSELLTNESMRGSRFWRWRNYTSLSYYFAQMLGIICLAITMILPAWLILTLYLRIKNKNWNIEKKKLSL